MRIADPPDPGYEALQQIRRDEPKSFTAQSYAYFGDPHARVLLQ